MLILGVDTHKRSHTIVAIDGLGRGIGQLWRTTTIATTSAAHLGAGCAGLSVMATQTVCGRSRIVGICRDGWSAICWPLASGWFGCRRS